MGLEIISNIGATYKEVPKEVIPKTNNTTTQNMEMMHSVGTQAITQSETKAVNNSEESQKKGEYGEKSNTYQNGNHRLKKALEKANKKASEMSQKTHCEFQYHEDTNRISISIKDDETGEVIKEIPAEETLDMLSKMWELAGLFVDDRR